jgi:hypothetical protein
VIIIVEYFAFRIEMMYEATRDFWRPFFATRFHVAQRFRARMFNFHSAKISASFQQGKSDIDACCVKNPNKGSSLIILQRISNQMRSVTLEYDPNKLDRPEFNRKKCYTLSGILKLGSHIFEETLFSTVKIMVCL